MIKSIQYRILTVILLLGALPLLAGPTSNLNDRSMNQEDTILIHLTQGPENPTVAALAFLVARTAVEDGHDVTLFLAGDAVQLMRDGALNNLEGLGTGKLMEHYNVLADAGTDFFLSGMSSKSRGLAEEEVRKKNVTFASPSVLVDLTLESENLFVY